MKLKQKNRTRYVVNNSQEKMTTLVWSYAICKTPEQQDKHFIRFLLKYKVSHVLPRKTPSGVTLKLWT